MAAVRVAAGLDARIAGQAAPTRQLRVFMAQGKGATSFLDEDKYRRVFRDIFQQHVLSFDAATPKPVFLKQFFESDVVYLSLHSKPTAWTVGNGDPLTLDDLAAAYKSAGRSPSVVVVTGCRTLEPVAGAKMFPDALGISTRSTRQAYIGFKEPVEGYYADRFFRVFFAAWMNPRAPNQYLTLQEAKLWARDFIARRLKLQDEKASLDTITSFFKDDPGIADRLTIVGASNMKVTDLY